MGWQHAITGILLTMAAIFVAWRIWRTIAARKAAGCATGCGTCPSTAQQKGSQGVVQIQPPGSPAAKH